MTDAAKKRGERGVLSASVILVIRASLKSFSQNRNLETAATLAFYAFLCSMPLLLLMALILSAVSDGSDGASALGHVLADIFPTFNAEWLGDLGHLSMGRGLGLLSGALLLWSMTPLAGAMRSALAKMFKLQVKMHIFLSKAIDLAAVLSFVILFLALTAIKVLVEAPGEGAGFLATAWYVLLRTVVPFALSVLFIGMFFRVFSPVKLSWSQWLLGAVAVTVLWAIMRNAFIVFVQFNPNFGYAFGSMKAIFLLIVWVYYSFAALLLGAEIMANTYRRDALLLRGLLDHDAKARPANKSLMKKFEREIEAGHVLFNEGDAGAEMFVVLEGAIRLSRGGRDLATMGPGKYFGEMSLLGNAPRTATAVAAESSRLAVINKGNFDLLVRENPVLVRGILEELARRLEDMNRRLNAAAETGKTGPA